MPIPIVTQPKSKIRARLFGECSRRASARPANPVHALSHPSLSHQSIVGILCALSTALLFVAVSILTDRPAQAAQDPSSFPSQSQADADQKSVGCVSCHTSTDEPTMHPTKTVHLACINCHGGNSEISVATNIAPNSPEYAAAKQKAHVQPTTTTFRNPAQRPRERLYTEWLRESADYIKFINPGDLRVALETCGASNCHANAVRAVSTSMMTHSGMLW